LITLHNRIGILLTHF